LDESLPDHYATLGLDRRCTAAQIRAAYRLLAKRHHPDLNHGAPEATERARVLNAAHEVLSDPARRRDYDRDRADRCGRPAPRAATKIERNLSQDVRLRIEELLRGTALEVRVNDPANPDGPEVLPLVIPPETAPGARFRLPRTGHFAGGIVTVRVRVLPSGRFKVRGADLRAELRISARRAAQGGGEMLPGPLGSMLRVQIPPGVSRGEVLRIVGEGLPKPRGGRGDLLVRVTYRPEVRIIRAGSR
jgi:DnaJ-class molecular chaperone